MTTLPLPSFYTPTSARFDYNPDQMTLMAAATDYRKSNSITPAASDRTRIHLLLIDVQRDFCFPEGTLYVGGRSGSGAIDDSRRTAEFIYRNLGAITDITTTMDTHFAYQIFFASFWIDSAGAPLTPFRVITTTEIKSGAVRPNPAMAWWLCSGNYAWLLKQVIHYTKELEREGKYALYLWPPHCLLGSTGHALAGNIHEARLFHSFTRGSQSWCEVKGGHPLTENYSVFRPEVLTRHDGAPLAQRNAGFLKKLVDSDAVIIAGQAASHCVKSSIDDLLDDIAARDPSLVSKVYILTDCMSSVAIPDGAGGFVADFTPESEAALKRFESAGMHLVESMTPMNDWPDLIIS